MERRQTFHNWLRVHKDRIEFARKGYLQVLFDDYNHEHPEAQLRNKPELWRWLYNFRRTNKVPIHYCPARGNIKRRRPEHSNYVEKN